MPTSERETANIFSVEGSFDPLTTITELRLSDGRIFRIPTALLSEAVSGSSPNAETFEDDGAFETGDSTMVVPIIEESLDVSKRTVATGKVRIEKTVQAYDVVLDEALAVHTWTVERIPMNLPIDVEPAVRQEGNTTIYPLLEEKLMVTKQLILKEELRVTRNDFERRDTQTVTLRREQLKVERETLG